MRTKMSAKECVTLIGTRSCGNCCLLTSVPILPHPTPFAADVTPRISVAGAGMGAGLAERQDGGLQESQTVKFSPNCVTKRYIPLNKAPPSLSQTPGPPSEGGGLSSAYMSVTTAAILNPEEGPRKPSKTIKLLLGKKHTGSNFGQERQGN